MTLKINKLNTKEISNFLNNKLKNKLSKGNLSSHFGKLKRNLDGLEYQLKIRQDEN